MTPEQTLLVDAVRARFGPKAAVTDANDIAPWLSDWRDRYHGAAAAILAPASTEEAAAIVGLAHRGGVPLVPQGGNTSMVGGATPPADGHALILSTRRMNRIRSIDPASGLAVAEAGVILANFHEAVLERGMRFPLTLGSRGSATIGGLTSTNAGGTQVLRFGTMRSLVAGVEAILPDGQVHDGLAALKKDNRGYDLTQLLVGAEGTLGLITAVSLRLVPAITARAIAWVGLASPEDALSLLRQMEAATRAIESFEIIPNVSLGLVLKFVPNTRAPLETAHPWHVLIEAVASTADDEPPADLLERLLLPALESGLASDAVVAATEAQAESFWHIRDSISEAERAEGPAAQHDISIPVATMPRFMVEAAAACEARFPGTSASAFGHLGDGNVHFHVRAAPGTARDAFYPAQSDVITSFVNDLVVASGGSISAEHGIGVMKIDELERLSSPARMAALRAVKAAFDPGQLMNPGKLVRLAHTPRGQ